MYLTNQPFKRTWEEKPQSILIKDWQYYKSQYNIWENQERTCDKIYSFYHQGVKQFKDTHYSDEELQRIQLLEENKAKQLYHLNKIQQTQERLANRKLEREMLQSKSNQKVFTIDEQQLTEFKNNDPYLYQEMTLKKSTNYKDPSRSILSSSQKEEAGWNQLNQMPSHSIEKVIRPKILEMDAQGCQNIINKINEEKKMQEVEKDWVKYNREKIRDKLTTNQQKLDSLQKKSGQKVKRGQWGVNNFQGGKNLFSSYTNSLAISRINEQFFQQQEGGQGRGGDGYQAQDGTRFKNLLEMNKQVTTLQSPDNQNNISIRKGVKTCWNKSRTQILAQPKEKFEPNNVFDHQEFRGLLHADYEEAIQNAEVSIVNPSMRPSSIQTNSNFMSLEQPRFITTGNSSQMSLVGQNFDRKYSSTTKELFPIPELSTPKTFLVQEGHSSSMISSKRNKSELKQRQLKLNKEGLSQFIRYGYSTHNIQNPFAIPFNPAASKFQNGLTHIKSASELSKFVNENKLAEFQVDEKQQVEEEIKELNEFIRITQQSKRKNRYPRTALDEALNYNKRFQEHLESKKSQKNNNAQSSPSQQQQF